MSIWRPYHNELAKMTVKELELALKAVEFDISDLPNSGLRNHVFLNSKKEQIKSLLLTK